MSIRMGENISDPKLIKECARGAYDDILVRADNGSTSFAKSKAEIKKKNLTNGILLHSKGFTKRNLEEVFDNPNICIGPTWIHKSDRDEYKDELVQYRFIDCSPSPLCKGNKPCVR